LRRRPRSGALFGLAVAIMGAGLGCGGGGNGPADAAGGGDELPDAGVPADTARAADRASAPVLDVGASAADVSGDTLASDAAGPDLAPAPDAAPVMPGDSVVWAIDNLQSIGGHSTMVLGAPAIIDTPAGKALQFDGVDDAVFVDNHPLAGLSQFTVEIFFRPDPGGAPAQRWFHMQEGTTGGRVLFETRLMGNDFVLDVFVESKGGNVALYTPKFTHPLGAWYHVAAVIDGKRAHHYVNGMEESNVALTFVPQGPGQTSIGVRFNQKYFFKGAVRLARFTPRALTPAEFMMH
jgi:concanavalin A-like lectin/glucanase superfamily protein